MNRTNACKTLLVLGLLALVFTGCTASRVTLDKNEIAKIKKVAVVLYSVPKSISYADDPKNPSSKGLSALANAATTLNNGPQAATLSLDAFIDNMNKANLGYTFMSRADMLANPAFSALAARFAQDTKPAMPGGGFGKALSFMNTMGGGDRSVGVGPTGMPSFGLAHEWSSAPSALVNAPGEMDYLKEAAQDLNVDAVWVINDPGFTFGCEACVGGTGTGTTGSSFLATLVTPSGKVLVELRQWFAYGSTSAAMVGYVVNPLQHDTLFKGHGEKLAHELVKQYKEGLE